MSLKAKLVSVISAFVLILTLAIVSVWAVSQANVTMGGTVGFKADNVYAKVSATVSGMDENPTLPTLIFSEGDDASPVELIEEWADLSLIFANSNTPIQIEITVENLSGERALYAKIDDQIGVVANLTKTVTSSSQDALGRYIEVPISSSISYTITLSPTDPNSSVNGLYEYLITLVDESEATGIQIQASANQTDLGQVTGGGMYDLGDEITLTATPSGSNTFLAWASSTNPEEMEILSTSSTYSFELTMDSPRTYYALFNQKTSTSQPVEDLVYTFYNEAKLASVTGTNPDSLPSGDFTIPSVVESEGNSYKVYSIGDAAFYRCSSLTSITIPEGVTSIGAAAFLMCRGLTSITIPEGVTSIGAAAFSNCSSLTSITIPEGVTSIGDSAFYYCSSLTSITIPEGVTSIGDSAFDDCSSLTSITIPEGVTSIGEGAFNSCSSLTSITIPEGVTSIGDFAFSDCSSLTSITIPEGVTSIGQSAFDGCSSLEAFYGNGNSYYTINDNRALIVDGGKTFLAYAAANPATSYSIPEGVTSIGHHAFYNCSRLASITLPSTLTSIGEGAFSNCSDLASVTIPEGVTSIGDSAFSSCSNLTSITIPERVTSIGISAFAHCSSLAEISINGNISLDSSHAFWVCSNLTKLTLGANVTTLPTNLFTDHNLTYLTEIVVEEGSTLSAALPDYATWYKDNDQTPVTSFSGAGTYSTTKPA